MSVERRLGRPRRVLMVYNTARYLLRLRRELLISMIKAGDDVVALVPFDESVDELQTLGVRCVELPMTGHSVNPFTELRTLLSMVREVRRLAPDVMFCFTIKPIVYGAIAAKIARVRGRFAMITGLGLLFAGNSFSGRLTRFLATHAYRMALRRCDAVFFQNHEHRMWFVSNMVINEAQAELINGSGVDLDAFAARPMPTGPVSFVMACRLLRYKGVGEYIEAATRVAPRHPDVTFVLAGPLVQGPGSISSLELAALLKGSPVEYRGEQADVRPLLRASSVVVLPSYYPEGVPRILIEALALGRAIITTDTAGCRTTVIDTVSGLLVEPRDPRSLADAMIALINTWRADEDGRHLPGLQTMGDAGRALAVERFDVRQVNARIHKRVDAVQPASADKGGAPGSV